MRILAAIDDSNFSEAVVQVVAKLARAGSEVHVLHVHEPVVVVPGLGGALQEAPDYVKLHREAVAAAKKLTEAAGEKLRGAGCKVSAEVVEGEPKVRIVERAAEWKADMIVIGSHGRKGLQRFLMGSVSEAVARHAPCSVLIVRLPAAG